MRGDRFWVKVSIFILTTAALAAVILLGVGRSWPVRLALASTVVLSASATALLLARRDHAVQRMAEMQVLHRAIINSAPNAVVVSDSAGHVIMLNPAAERMFARPASAVRGALMSDLIVSQVSAGAEWASLPGNILDRLGERLTGDAMKGDGTLFPVEISVLRVGVGQETTFVAYIRDMTDQKRAAAAKEERQERLHQSEKLSAMGSLLAGVAHELNNPMAILVTQATLLREKAPTPDVERRAERIHAAAQRAGRIVKSFLAMARQKAPVRQPVPIAEIVDNAVELLGYGLRSAGIIVERSVGPDLPPVNGDRELLGQVFANIILNAQQALLDKPDDRRISIKAACNGGSIDVSVADNGPGVPDSIGDRVFEPYFTTKPAGAGTGIGLSICRSVVSAHDGTINLARAESGACFEVRLPIADRVPAVASAPPVVGRGLSILVVDDEKDVGDSLAELVNVFGHQAVVLSSGSDALDRIRQQRFDAVFTDLRMPGMNGLSLRQAIKDIDTGLARKTVIVTGDTVMGPRNEGQPADGEGFVLEKPFAAEEVRALLEKLRVL